MTDESRGISIGLVIGGCVVLIVGPVVDHAGWLGVGFGLIALPVVVALWCAVRDARRRKKCIEAIHTPTTRVMRGEEMTLLGYPVEFVEMEGPPDGSAVATFGAAKTDYPGRD